MLQELCKIIFITFILGIIIYVFFVKRKKIGGIKKTVIGLSILILMIFVAIFPLDNYIFSFSSPIDVARYSEIGKVLTSVNNEEIGVVILEKPGVKNSAISVVSRKTGDKWRLSSSKMNYSFYSGILGDNYIFSAYRSVDTDDVIVLIRLYDLSTDVASSPSISDSNNSTFYKAEILEETTLLKSMYYTILDSADENYELSINGDTSKILSKK